MAVAQGVTDRRLVHHGLHAGPVVHRELDGAVEHLQGQELQHPNGEQHRSLGPRLQLQLEAEGQANLWRKWDQSFVF